MASAVLLAAGCDTVEPASSDNQDPEQDTSTTLPPHFDANLDGVMQSSSSFGDVNGDGNLDLLLTGLASDGDPSSTLYFGNGDGTFSQADIDLAGVFVFTSASIDDANGDGNPDLLITGEDNQNRPVQDLDFGDGAGSFTKATAELDGGERGSSSIADFNGDGQPDLLITGRSGGYLLETRVYLGNGDGTFSKIDTDLPGVEAGSHSIGDVNGDGTPDLVLAGTLKDDSALSEVFLGNGDGTFTKANAGLSPVIGSATSIADVDSDGHLDLLISGVKESREKITTLYLGNGDGTFSRADAELKGVSFGGTEIADVNDDGHLDLVVTGMDDDDNRIATIYLGHGDGSFSEADAGLLGAWEGSVSVVDVDQDQDLDILITGETAYADSVAPGSILYENLGDWNAESN